MSSADFQENLYLVKYEEERFSKGKVSLPLFPSDQPTYWYEGRCPYSGKWLRLPRTKQAEAIARTLMAQLADDPVYAREGKMYGILLVETPDGSIEVLKAFSGLLHGKSMIDGWVPPIPGRDEVIVEETRTLAQLEIIKQQIITLHSLPERDSYATLCRQFEQQWQEMGDRHRHRKQQRQVKRQHLSTHLTGEALTRALEELNQESQRDGMERRHFKRQRDAVLMPLKQVIDESDRQIRQLKRQRKELSRTLQTQLHAAYRLTNFRGISRELYTLIPDGAMPTGTGDCCAPKLLHYAATHHLKPLAMAEFWWGSPSQRGDKIQGEFYGACTERCQPLMGFLLSGMVAPSSHPAMAFEQGMSSGESLAVPVVYEDEWLIAVDKPAGLLSVPGRYHHNQDSVLSRLQMQRKDAPNLSALHRLDQDTSGILLFAKDPEVHYQISQQFQQHQVKKTYEALLAGRLTVDQGVIELPLWGNPGDRPRQVVDFQRGKPSMTRFQVIGWEGECTRVQFFPVTGRTHQLRVHAADPQGLGISIVGDRLYGSDGRGDRLMLHASKLVIRHPKLNQPLQLTTVVPFYSGVHMG